MCIGTRGHPGAKFRSAPPNLATMPCSWEQFRFCHKTSKPMNMDSVVSRFLIDADGRSHEKHDQFVAACCFIARIAKCANLRADLGLSRYAPHTCLVQRREVRDFHSLGDVFG